MLSPPPATGLDARNPEAANCPRTNVQNPAANTARKTNEAIIVHLIAKYSLGNRIASEAEMTGSGFVIGSNPKGDEESYGHIIRPISLSPKVILRKLGGALPSSALPLKTDIRIDGGQVRYGPTSGVARMHGYRSAGDCENSAVVDY
jgi:hypothetical protein